MVKNWVTFAIFTRLFSELHTTTNASERSTITSDFGGRIFKVIFKPSDYYSIVGPFKLENVGVDNEPVYTVIHNNNSVTLLSNQIKLY